MFPLDMPPVAYADPWNKPLSERLAMLCRAKRRIAYFYEAPNNSTFRYRAYNMVQALNASKVLECSASYFFLADYERFDEIAHYVDVMIICRSGYSSKLNHLITKLRGSRKRILFDIDDLVFDTKYAHLVINTLGLEANNEALWDQWFAMIARMGATLTLCDGAITTNHFLAAKIKEFSGLPVSIIPNFMNNEQLEISRSIFEKKMQTDFSGDESINLGYFSGSPSHRLDYALVENAIFDVMASNERVTFTVVGYIETSAILQPFSRRIRKLPFQDYINLQIAIGSVEFNLMPLQSNAFTDCKSELKYFEAAATGTLSIASPSNTYARAIDSGINGYLAHAHQWTSVINKAISLETKYKAMAIHAREDALSKYSGSLQGENIINMLGCYV